MAIGKALVSGLIGASTVTLLNEAVRKVRSDAPRLDLLGARGVSKLIGLAGYTPPDQPTARNIAMAGDIVANTAYYSAAALLPLSPLVGGASLGLLAGIGAVALPGPMGLGEDATTRTPQTQVMSAAWYLLAGLAAGAASSLLSRKEQR